MRAMPCLCSLGKCRTCTCKCYLHPAIGPPRWPSFLGRTYGSSGGPIAQRQLHSLIAPSGAGSGGPPPLHIRAMFSRVASCTGELNGSSSPRHAPSPFPAVPCRATTGQLGRPAAAGHLAGVLRHPPGAVRRPRRPPGAPARRPGRTVPAHLPPQPAARLRQCQQRGRRRRRRRRTSSRNGAGRTPGQVCRVAGHKGSVATKQPLFLVCRDNVYVARMLMLRSMMHTMHEFKALCLAPSLPLRLDSLGAASQRFSTSQRSRSCAGRTAIPSSSPRTLSALATPGGTSAP